MVRFAWTLWAIHLIVIIVFTGVISYAKVRRLRYNINWFDILLTIATFVFLSIYLFAK